MPSEINDINKAISFAESILIPNNNFDDERVNFIKNFESLDLQSVPGSGKTTALLAKLIVLTRQLPLEENQGILVLSHTNAAINEIKHKLQFVCPELFLAPNYLSTIQGFVDRHLAKPCYSILFGKRPEVIDGVLYSKRIPSFIKYNLSGFSTQTQKNARYYLLSNKNITTYTLKVNEGSIKLYDNNFKALNIKKPKRGKNYRDWSEDEKAKIEKWLINFKLNFMKKTGLLSFQDAYFLADLYLNKYPRVRSIIRRKFKYVFVDEMQDVDVNQFELLQTLFSEDDNVIYQKIGDNNQSIFSGKVSVKETWVTGHNVININGSYRLNAQVAELVSSFAITRNRGFSISGLGEGDLKPHMIVFDTDKITKVIKAYSGIISSHIESGKIIPSPKDSHVAIGWRKQNKDESKIGISDYYPNFNLEINDSQKDIPHLQLHLLKCNFLDGTLRQTKTILLDCIINVLKLEEVRLPTGSLTNDRFLDYIKKRSRSEYDELMLNLYRWSCKIYSGRHQVVFEELIEYLKAVLGSFDKEIDMSLDYTTGDRQGVGYEGIGKKKPNKVNYDGFTINIQTVHSVKGQTHTSTLYLETDYYGTSECYKLANQFNFNNISGNVGVRAKESAKMCYVGLSRPKSLLCVAIRKTNFERIKDEIDKSKWVISECC